MTMIAELEQVLDDARDEVTRLEGVAAALPARIAAAGQARDREALAALRLERDRLPDQLIDARLAALDAQDKLLDAMIADGLGALEALKPRRQDAAAAFEAAKAQLDAVQGEVYRVTSRLDSLRMQRNGVRGKTESLMAEMMRSAQMAGAVPVYTTQHLHR